MSRVSGLLVVLIVLGAQVCALGASVRSGETGVMPPPALNIPYGAQVATEVNISDNDLLGIIKQTLPAVLQAVTPLIAQGAGAELGKPVDEKTLDFTPLFESISGVTNLRVIVARLPKTATTAQMMKDVEAGVAKIGKFNKVLADSEFVPGFGVLYAQSDNGGYIGYMYDANRKMLYAARVVGNVDVPKLMTWATGLLTKYGISSIQSPTQPGPAPTQDPKE